MSAVGLEEMSKSEVLQYVLAVHEVHLRKKSQLDVLVKRTRELDDTLENPLEVGEEVRYKNEDSTCTVSKVGKILEITDQGQNVFEVARTDLARVVAKPIQPAPADEIKATKTDSEPDLQAEAKPGPKAKAATDDTSAPEEKQHYPREINESSYRPKPGGIVIGGLPSDGSANTRKTGVTHVLDNKVETAKAD